VRGAAALEYFLLSRDDDKLASADASESCLRDQDMT